ncbi:MAG: glycoside hydrolase family 9 protein [Oscillospiraceae bacterium]|nr:glycoside hydrolase family 9 protein [Oscillospiraceae bacterium]
MNRKYFDTTPKTRRMSPFGIFADQAGYYPESVKRAYIPFECGSFQVTDMNGAVCYSGSTFHAGKDSASGDDVWTADFTPLDRPGSYVIRAGGRTSAMFCIGGDVYSDVFDKTSKAYYYLRCGCGVEERYGGVWHHGKCHTSPARLWEDWETQVDVSGGWHDAGDYGRYVTAGACACAHLLYAYRLFPKAFEGQELNIPEGNTPDILSEVRYELEWLLKMQREDGGVYHKVTTALHAPFVMPEEDTEQLYLFPVSSMAVADTAAVCALGSHVYRDFDDDFSGRLLAAAKRSARWLEEHPEFIGFHNPEGCNTGSYGEGDDHSNRFWAYAELYAATGEAVYHDRMEQALKEDFPLCALGYGEVGGLGALSYILCDRERDTALVSRFENAFRSRGEELSAIADSCGYSVAMEGNDYCWGSNMGLMTRAMIFAVNDRLLGERGFREYALSHIHCLLGANPLGISYVTGVGEFRCNYPHLRPAFADGIEECIPGMVAGGPNGHRSDPFARGIIPEDTPPMKCYADDTASYSLNEITIYWNSPAVFVLAYLQ